MMIKGEPRGRRALLRAKVLLLLLFLISPAVLSHRIHGTRYSRFLLIETYVFENRGEDPIPLSRMDRAVNLFQNNSWQTVRLVNTSHPIEEYFNDSDGNPYALLSIPERIEGGENITVTITYEILSREQGRPDLSMEEAGNLTQIDVDLFSEHLASGGTWLTEDPEIRELAEKIAGNETRVLAIVEALIQWIAENITYEPFEVPRYPNETLKEGRGDCDDQSILLITLCRTLGIPAYLQVGCILSTRIKPVNRTVWDGHVRIHMENVGWHGWSVIYIPPWGWLPVDLTYAGKSVREKIEDAAVYRDYVILQQNISRYDYVGESRRSWRWIKNSTLYVTIDERAIILPEERTVSFPWQLLPPLLIGSTLILVLLYLRRRAYIDREAF